MRVAIFAVSLLGISISQVSSAQVLQTAEASTLNGAVPAVAMSNSGFSVPELMAPKITRPMLRTGVSGRGTQAVTPSVLTGPGAATPSIAQALPRASRVPEPAPRSLTDHLLAGVVALMLIAYQLRRKHRVLRPHPFTT